MKRKGTGIIFVNDKRQILLFLRDDKPGLPYRNMWAIPGGHVGDGETPDHFGFFCVKDFDDRME